MKIKSFATASLMSMIAIASSVSAAQAATNLITNGDFETPALSSGGEVRPNSTYAGWTFVNGNNASALVLNNQQSNQWTGSNVYSGESGVQFAGIQKQSSISQNFIANSTSAILTWLDGGRPSMYGGCCTGNETYDVVVGGVIVGSESTTSAQNFISHSLSLTNLIAGDSYTLEFAGLTTSDDTAFIDNVSIIGAIPEPASWALMLVGMGAIGFAMRRRAAVAVSYA